MPREVKGMFLDEFLQNFNLNKKSAKKMIHTLLDKGVVYTHDGPIFHIDEVFAIALLMMYKDKYNLNDFKVIRTRKNLSKDFLLVDVGNSFLDHHFSDTLAPIRKNGIRYSSAGLVWSLLGEEFVDEEYLNDIDKKIFMPIDANDNGQQFAPSAYISIISNMNPNWNEELDINEQFVDAIFVAYDILDRIFMKYRAKKEAKLLVKEIYEKARDKQIIQLPQPMEWQEVLCRTESLLVLWQNEDSTWSLQTVPKEPGKFSLKIQYPEEWRGQSSERISALTNAKIKFVHPQGHYLIAETKEDVIKIINLLL